ncbi:hypothetical protein [Streptomyces sp. NPDC050738]|uniref:hypothetical protein n=1 Tax=Streptomyces sp. NPDC050738 TaxID=3154744 RepID=UPI0034433CAB
MKIGTEDNQASLGRKWGVPLGVAAGVAALSVAAVAVFGGVGNAKPHLASPAAPSPSTKHASKATPSSASSSYTITSRTTTPIAAGAVGRILASCLGSDASRYHAVIAVRTPVASQEADGVVIAVNSADQYVQCESKGDKGTSRSHPPTFINDRLWGTGHTIAYFNSTSDPAGKGKYVMVGSGHYTANIARITVSYDNNPTEYPAVMAGGAFVYTAALSVRPSQDDPHYTGPNPYIHAYNASGKEIYNQQKDPEFVDKP